MIYHYKDNIKDIKLLLKTKLKYSNEFSFIPIKIKKDDFMIQTPSLFVPYGIQKNMNLKDQVVISFQNKDNDNYTQKFLDDLESIYQLIYDHFKSNNNINPFIKDYKDKKIMNLKIDSSCLIYDRNKKIIDDLPIYSYASFIIHLAGLWISDNDIWFQWYSLQIKVDNKISLSKYSFKDKPNIPPPPPLPPPPPMVPMKDKYKKMISLGIPTDAVNQKKILDCRASINKNMLLSVKLKKNNQKKDIIQSDMNGFEPPSLDTLQLALKKLRSVINYN